MFENCDIVLKVIMPNFYYFYFLGGKEMRKSKLKLVAVVLILAIVILSTITVTYAAGSKKMLEAWYGLSNVRYNGQDMTSILAPFAANQTTYVPLRKVCDMFNKNISWDQSTHTVVITDKVDQTVSNLEAQLILKDQQISLLQSQIKKLEEQLDDNETVDLDDLQKELNQDYGEYEDIIFDIYLSGDEDEITVKIEVDLDEYEEDWDGLRTSERTEYIEDVCGQILDEFEDAEIDGYFKDSSSSSSSKLLSFYIDSDGEVEFGTRDNEGDFIDLDDELYDEYVEDFDDIEMTIELEGDSDEVTFTLSVDLDEYGGEYDDYLDDGDIEELMGDIYQYIEEQDEYEDSDIEGYVYDTDEEENIAEYYKASGGGFVFDDDL